MPEAMKHLRSVVSGFERLVHHERHRLELGRHPRRFVLVNSATGYTDPYILTQLDCSHATTHSRVRRATVKHAPTAGLHATRNLSWGDRLRPPRQPLMLHPGKAIDVAELADLRGFGRWMVVARSHGDLDVGSTVRAPTRLRTPSPARRHGLAISFGRVGVRRGERLDVRLLIDGSRVARRSFPGGTQLVTWRAEIPREALARPAFEAVLELEGPESWQTDARQLGLHVRSLGIEHTGLHRFAGDVVRGIRSAARSARRLRR